MKSFHLKFAGNVVGAAFANFELPLLALLSNDNVLAVWNTMNKDSILPTQQFSLNKWTTGKPFGRLKWDIEDSNRILLFSKSALLVVDWKHPGNEIFIDFANSLDLSDAFFISKYPKRKGWDISRQISL